MTQQQKENEAVARTIPEIIVNKFRLRLFTCEIWAKNLWCRGHKLLPFIFGSDPLLSANTEQDK